MGRRELAGAPAGVEALTPAERHFLDVVAEHGLGPGVGECREAWGKVVEEREALASRRCLRQAPIVPPDWGVDDVYAQLAKARLDGYESALSDVTRLQQAAKTLTTNELKALGLAHKLLETMAKTERQRVERLYAECRERRAQESR